MFFEEIWTLSDWWSSDYLYAIIAVAVVLIAVIIWRIKEQHADAAASHASTSAGVAGAEEHTLANERDKKQALFFVFLGLAVAAVVAALVFKDGGGTGDSDNSAIAPFLPIWIAIWIPFMNKKNKKDASFDNKKQLKYAILALIAASAIGFLVYEIFRA